MNRYSLIVSDEHGRIHWRVCQSAAPFALIGEGQAPTVAAAKEAGLRYRAALDRATDGRGGITVNLQHPDPDLFAHESAAPHG